MISDVDTRSRSLSLVACRLSRIKRPVQTAAAALALPVELFREVNIQTSKCNVPHRARNGARRHSKRNPSATNSQQPRPKQHTNKRSFTPVSSHNSHQHGSNEEPQQTSRSRSTQRDVSHPVGWITVANRYCSDFCYSLVSFPSNKTGQRVNTGGGGGDGEV